MRILRIHVAIAMLRMARSLHTAAYAFTDIAAAIIEKAEQLHEKAR